MRRLLSFLLGACVVVASAVAVTATAGPAAAAATTFVGSLGKCTTSKGALVAVNFGRWGGPAVRGCDTTPTTGIELLTTAGFKTTGTRHDGPAFICRIGHPLFKSGTQYPTPAQDPCVVTPPATAYWSFWLAAKGKNTWTYSPNGAFTDHPANGEVEAWTFGATDVAGTKGQPPFTPNQVRAGLPAGAAAKAANAPQAKRFAPRALAAGADTPDLGAGADYLVDNLIDGHYYDPFGIGFADYGLTMDGILALAASGNRDAALRTAVRFLDQRGKDASDRSVDDYTGIGTDFASAGSIGKEALVAEATGYDPRDFGGHDLIAALDGLVCTKAIENVCAAPGNYRYAQSTFSQVLAILAQLRAGDTRGAAAPIAYLEGLQNTAGAFPSVLPGGDSETDSTAMAAMGLAMVGTAKARTAVAKALKWLAGQQASDGGFPGASGDSVNSAAVTLQALRLDAGTYASQIAKAERFLAGQQNSDGGFNVAADGQPGSDLRASAQAVGGAVGTPFGSVLNHLPAKVTAGDGAHYLVAQLTDGDHYSTDFNGQSFPDQGLTADGVFALLAAGGHASSVTAMTTWLAGQVDAYTDASGQFGGPYSGALAKLALTAESTGRDPHGFGGTDLLALLKAKVCTAAISGDFSPCTAAGDFYNAFSGISQSLGVLALDASPVIADHLAVTDAPVVRLHQLQCKDGGFSSVLIAPGAACTSDVDATAFAVQALATVPGTDEWLGAAQAYLETVQRDDGLYVGAAGVSSNSTAVAADALQSLVDALSSPTADPPAPKTVAPVVAWQSALHGLTTLAVAGGGYRISAATTGADLRASTQAVQAAAQRSLISLSGATIRSLPRVAQVAPPTGGTSTPPSSSAPTSNAPTREPNAAASPVADGTAATGVHTAAELQVALALLVLGMLLAFAGRRRVVVARHRRR